MKLTNPEFIRKIEKDFINSIEAELDWNAVSSLFFRNFKFSVQDESLIQESENKKQDNENYAIQLKNGDIIVHKDKIAYKLNLEIKMPFSLILNREGEFLEFNANNNTNDLFPENPQNNDENISGQFISQEEKDKVACLAINIADIISEINEN